MKETVMTQRDPTDILQEGVQTHKNKDDDYGEAWLIVGEILWEMAGKEPVEISSPEEWSEIFLYAIRQIKIIRGFNLKFRSDDLNYEDIVDSHEDEMVYASMHAALEEINND